MAAILLRVWRVDRYPGGTWRFDRANRKCRFDSRLLQSASAKPETHYMPVLCCCRRGRCICGAGRWKVKFALR